MDLENIMLSEMSKTNYTWYHSYVESKKIQMNVHTKETDSWTWRTALWSPKGRTLQGDGVGSWGEQIEATVYRMDEKTKVLLYSTGNYI